MSKKHLRTIASIAIMVYAPYLGNLVGITSSVGQAAFAGFTSGLVGSGGDLKQAFIGGVFAVFSAGVLHGMDTGWRKTFAHGLTGGARSKVSGGRFKDGFIGGFVGQSLEQHGVYEEMGITSTPRNYTERMYNAVASFVVGGTSARLTGGSFTNGGMSAAFARMFNDLKNSDWNFVGWANQQDDGLLGFWGRSRSTYALCLCEANNSLNKVHALFEQWAPPMSINTIEIPSVSSMGNQGAIDSLFNLIEAHNLANDYGGYANNRAEKLYSSDKAIGQFFCNQIKQQCK